MLTPFLPSEVYFEHPERVFGIITTAALVAVVGMWFVLWQRSIRQRSNGFLPAYSSIRSLLTVGCSATALILVAIAFADVRWSTGPDVAIRSEEQTVLLLDRSRSMLAEDVGRSRWDLARQIINDILDQSAGSPVALVSFAGDARVDSPLTRNPEQLQDRLRQLQPLQNDTAGTVIDAGLTLASDCFADRFAGKKRLIILTDGEFGPDRPARYPTFPADSDVWVIGIGDAEEGGPIPLYRDGEMSLLKYEGEIVHTRLSPESLEELAAHLGGRFHTVDSPSRRTLLLSLMSEQYSPAETVQTFPQSIPLYSPLLLMALVILLTQHVIERTRSGSLSIYPATVNSRTTSSLLLFLAVFGMGANGPTSPANLSPYELTKKYNEGVAAYEREDWSGAVAAFDVVHNRGTGELHQQAAFNLANTLFQQVRQGGIRRAEALSKLDRAISFYRANIQSRSRVEDARVNLELAYDLKKQIENQPPIPPSNNDDNQSNNDNSQNGSDKGDDNRNSTDNDSPSDSSNNSDSPDSPDGSKGQKDQPSSSDSSTDDVDKNTLDQGAGDGRSNSPATNEQLRPLTEEEAAEQLERIRAKARYREGRSLKNSPRTTPPFPW